MRNPTALASACLLLAGSAQADSWVADFSDGADDGLVVTVLNDELSDLVAGPAQGVFAIEGDVAAGSEPKVILEPPVAIRAGDSWSVEARVLLRHDLLDVLETRDSLQVWWSLASRVDPDDEVRAKSGLLKGVFQVGEQSVDDGYFASSGYDMDDDSLPGSGDVTEYSTVDPAVASPEATVPMTLRIEYDAGLAELFTSYRLGDGPFVVYPLADGGGAPAPALDPMSDWMLAPDDEIDVVLMVSATRAAHFGSEPAHVSASFTLLPGDAWIEDLAVTGTLIPLPEPSAAASLSAGLGLLGVLARRRQQRA